VTRKRGLYLGIRDGLGGPFSTNPGGGKKIGCGGRGKERNHSMERIKYNSIAKIHEEKTEGKENYRPKRKMQAERQRGGGNWGPVEAGWGKAGPDQVEGCVSWRLGKGGKATLSTFDAGYLVAS